MKSWLRLIKSGLSAWVCCLFIGLAFFLNGCGSGKGQSPSSTSVIVQPNVRVLPSDGSVTISNVTPTSVTLSGSVPALSPGIILVSGQGQGLLRKVVSAAKSGNSQVVQTVAATLLEVFKQANISITKTLGSADYAEVTAVAPGVTVTPYAAGKSARTRDTSNISHTIDFGKAQVGTAVELDGNATIGLQVTLQSVTTPQGTSTTQFIATLNGTANVGIHAVSTVTLPSVKVHIAHLLGFPIPFKVGSVPIVVTPTIDIYSTADGQIQAGVDAAVTGTASVGSEIDYTGGKGWTSSPVNSQTLTVNPTFAANASATFHVTPIHGETSLKIYDLAGPYVNGDYPQFTFKLQAQTSPPSGPPLEIDADFQGTVGFSLSVLALPDFSVFSVPFDFHFVLYPGGSLLGITLSGITSTSVNMSALLRVDTNTGIGSSAVTFLGIGGPGAIDATNNLLYIYNQNGYDGSSYLAQLVVIDLQANSVVRAVNTPFGLISEIVYDSGKQRLLGVADYYNPKDGSLAGSKLVAINPNTGIMADVVALPEITSGSWLAMDTAHHLLYVTLHSGSHDQPINQLVVIDLQTDSIIRTVNTGDLNGIGYDTGTMKFFGVVGNPQSGYQLATIDPNSGAVSPTASIPRWNGVGARAIDSTNHLIYLEGQEDYSVTQLMVFDTKTGLLIRTVDCPVSFEGYVWLGFYNKQGITN